MQVYLDSSAERIVNTQFIDYLDDNVFETDEDYFPILINRSYKYHVTKKLILVKELNLLKLITVKNVWLITIDFKIMGLNFRIPFVMVVMI